MSQKDWELPDSRIWLAEINIESGLDFPIQTGILTSVKIRDLKFRDFKIRDFKQRQRRGNGNVTKSEKSQKVLCA